MHTHAHARAHLHDVQRGGEGVLDRLPVHAGFYVSAGGHLLAQHLDDVAKRVARGDRQRDHGRAAAAVLVQLARGGGVREREEEMQSGREKRGVPHAGRGKGSYTH